MHSQAPRLYMFWEWRTLKWIMALNVSGGFHHLREIYVWVFVGLKKVFKMRGENFFSLVNFWTLKHYNLHIKSAFLKVRHCSRIQWNFHKSGLQREMHGASTNVEWEVLNEYFLFIIIRFTVGGGLSIWETKGLQLMNCGFLGDQGYLPYCSSLWG